MPIGHITQSGNLFIPREWRDELGIALNSEVIVEKEDSRIIIEPIQTLSLKDALENLSKEMKKKGIRISREEAIRDDLYD